MTVPSSLPDGAVYALGGMGSDTSPQALVRLYEPTKDHWLSLPSMPTPCYGASTFLHGNKIYVMGKDTALGQDGLTGICTVRKGVSRLGTCCYPVPMTTLPAGMELFILCPQDVTNSLEIAKFI